MATAGIMCTSCLQTFATSADLRAHYQCAWHLNNAKRKMQSLPPVSEADFAAEEQARTAVEEVTKGVGHLKQRAEAPAHAPAAAAVERKWAPGRGLFDGFEGGSVEESLLHMKRAQGFELPDVAKCTDLVAVLRVIADRIEQEPHSCLFCGNTFNTAGAVRSHMVNKNHARLGAYDEDLLDALEPFYDIPEEEILAGEDRPDSPNVVDGKLVLPDGREAAGRA
eukprot:CAMPEP_0204456706 /NCGR_PEP_ID=MMETSP0471-20130131/2309_1 /ASSEMBLY_ACC=CAM_ASM_000602 /TAXON_ID=2969 /ORGANISM="Oxyrrhis marina" /LENGTH=222 /DNA_ID=CAMNT_0051457039 /DNA_START=64 /DNA_END=728 /DNA_ORIENTATION=+